MFIHIALDTILGVTHIAENELRTTAKQVHGIDLLVSHTSDHHINYLNINLQRQVIQQLIHREPLWLLLSRNHSPSQFTSLSVFCRS